MAKQLSVFLYEQLIGQLEQDDVGKLHFQYDADWLRQSNAIPVSQSLPLQGERFNQTQCQGFFGGILPEEAIRKVIARNLQISANNDFSLLEKIGGECAGALSFLPVGQMPTNCQQNYEALNSAELEATIKKLATTPLLAGEADIRLSLAGAQEKIPVHFDGAHVALPTHGAASTHILKPENPRFKGLVFNEAFCLALAGAVGLQTALASTHRVGNIDYLLVQRYDRAQINDEIVRLHQEDFCQAMAVPSNMKYQSEGGPSLKQCFALLRQVSSAPVLDLQQLLKAVIFNFYIGNHDAHGKNFSFIYQRNNGKFTTRLAPFYDLVSTTFYPDLSTKMAMKLGGEYESKKIMPRHFQKLAEDVGFSPSMMKKTVRELGGVVIEHAKQLSTSNPIAKELAQYIIVHSERFLSEF